MPAEKAQAGCAQAGLLLSPGLIYGEKPRGRRFGLRLGAASVLTLPCSSCTFPSPLPLQLPALFFHHLDLFPPFPAVGFASCLHRDSDVVESMRHKLGELTDLHGLKRLVLLRKEGVGK